MVNKDYYALLGINQLASEDEIKRAYKQKALKHHPDKNHGDIDAEKKFMDINEAHDILSDPYKRSLYDRFGSEELRNYLGIDPHTHFPSCDIHYSDLGTDLNNDYPYDPYNYFVRYKDAATFYDLYVTLEEVNKGATRKMKITRNRYNAKLNTTVSDEKLLEIQIKPGWKEGTKITFEGEGDEGDQHTIAGDIVFIIRDKPHPIFERSNSDIIYRVKLTLKQALLGTLIVIPFLDSTRSPYQFHSHQEVLTPQTEKRFLNEGLPYPKDPTRRGDLIVKFDILFPKIVNDEQRRLVDCCFSNSIDSYQSLNSVFHTTIIEQTQQNESPFQTQQLKQSTSITQQLPVLPSKQRSFPNQNSTSTVKSPTASTSTGNQTNYYHSHQSDLKADVNSNPNKKSPSSSPKSGNKNKVSPIHHSTFMPPSGSLSSSTTVFVTNDTVL